MKYHSYIKEIHQIRQGYNHHDNDGLHGEDDKRHGGHE